MKELHSRVDNIERTLEKIQAAIDNYRDSKEM